MFGWGSFLGVVATTLIFRKTNKIYPRTIISLIVTVNTDDFVRLFVLTNTSVRSDWSVDGLFWEQLLLVRGRICVCLNVVGAHT